MAKFTFLELHLDDATITNNAPYSGAADAESAAIDQEETDEESGGPSILGLVALSLGLSVLAALAARALFGGDDAVEDLADLSE